MDSGVLNSSSNEQQNVSILGTTDITDSQKSCRSNFWSELVNVFDAYYIIGSLVVCIFGVVSNTINLLVLMHKDMMSSINSILTGLTVAHFIVMMIHLPLVVYDLIFVDEILCLEYTEALGLLIALQLGILHHGISTWLTLILALWRFIAVVFPLKSRIWCSHKRTLVAIALCYIFPALVSIPMYISMAVKEVGDICPRSAFGIFESNFAMKDKKRLMIVNIWSNILLLKFIPNLGIVILFLWLMWVLRKSNKRRQQLMRIDQDRATRPRDRTTPMLLVYVLLYLLTEMPYGIGLMLFIQLESKCLHFDRSYSNIVGVFQLLAIINQATSFIVYFAMSQNFRNTFCQLMKSWLMTGLPLARPESPCTSVYSVTLAASSVVTVEAAMEEASVETPV